MIQPCLLRQNDTLTWSGSREVGIQPAVSSCEDILLDDVMLDLCIHQSATLCKMSSSCLCCVDLLGAAVNCVGIMFYRFPSWTFHKINAVIQRLEMLVIDFDCFNDDY